MWLIDELSPGNPAYNLPYGYRLHGSLDQHALEEAFNEVISRHEMLRTTFSVQSGPLQQIQPAFKIVLKVTSLEHLPVIERNAQARALASKEAVRPFDLSRLPLIRVSLLSLGDADHVLVLNLHHIIADGLSIGVLMSEVDAFYRAATMHRPVQLPGLTIQYGDFASWQQRNAGDAISHQKQIDYWLRLLDGRLPVLQMPTDLPRPATQSFRGSNAFFSIGTELARELRHHAAAERCTVFMTFLAAFQLLLHRYSGDEDIIIGTPVAARTEEVQPLIGNFLNVVPLRGNLSGDPSFAELLHRARDSVLDAFANGDLPLERIVERLQFERDRSRPPVFQALLQVLPELPVRIGELEVSAFEFDLGFAQFDLSLHLYADSDGYRARFEYATDLFQAGTMQRLVANFLRLLREIVQDPSRPISRIPILSHAERDRVLREWNDTRVDFGAELLLHEPFEDQARRHPARIALEFEGRTLAYSDVNRRANQLARVLRSRGVGPNVLVGVLAERSFEMVIALLAVLKAGGAYVPLEPSYPPERLRHMLEDARAALVLAQRDVAGLLPQAIGPVIVLDDCRQPGSSESDANLERAATPDDLAYVIFTSGSTGRPKGAMNTHRGIHNRLQWMQREYTLGSDDCVLQKTPFGFDVSVWEFFWPLATGARLRIARPEGHKEAGYLLRAIRDSRVTTLHFVPSMLQAFLEEADAADCDSIKRVICSGEALSPELQERFFARLPGVELHNLYGPTEAAVDVTHWRCRQGTQPSVPIGRPIANTRIYILDARLEPVPVGVSGELFMGGVQVGRGYVGRPELTAERFVPDPFSNEPGARLYRTGDRARFLEDGAVEYLGRLDHQVKIRGQRIELGEIEATLERHGSVRQSVVMAREHAGSWSLVAYVVPDGAAPSHREMKEHLAGTLPQYMIPGDFVFLDALPLTSSGKVDRKRLPLASVPEAGRAERIEPRTPTEEMVTAAFRDFLGRADFGVLDNFFDLGGHSLAAARLMTRLRRASGLDLPLRVLFERPTPERLAEAIDALAWTASAPRPVTTAQDRVEIHL